jgi:AraC-like DNA-binding protein
MQNQVKVWRVAELYDAELLKGAYVEHAYPWHAHEELSLGLVVDGAVSLSTRSREGVATAGSFVLINVEEAHRGASASPQGWKCRTIHISPHIVQSTVEELRRFTNATRVRFRGPTFEDPRLASAFLELHYCSEGASSVLERQSRIVSLIAQLLERHTDVVMDLPKRLKESAAVRCAQALLDENLSDKVSLCDLARASGLPPFRLLRAFQTALGLSPHAYQTQARIRAAQAMLRRQERLADVAAATGFADQPHLTRVFKSIVGATPQQYRAGVATSLAAPAQG